MKRWMSVLLCLTMLFCLAGCTGGQGPAGEDPTAVTTAAPVPEEYTLPREEGCNQLTFYWQAKGVDYDKCDMWIWYPNADGRGYLFHPCEYGAKVILNVPQEITEVGFIVRRNCSDPGGSSWGDATKDYDGDRYALITGETTEIYLQTGDPAQYSSTDGGKTLTQDKVFTLAAMVAADQIQYHITPAARFTSMDQVKVREGDRAISVASLSSLNNEVVMGILTLAEPLDLTKEYTVELEGYGSKIALPTRIFDTKEFIETYTYDGDDLGATVKGNSTIFKLWAPTASRVVLNLFEAGNGGAAYETHDMERGDKGVWTLTLPCGHGTYYTYTVTTGAGTAEAVDPYARAAGVNGDRGMVVDLAKTNPAGFDRDRAITGITAYDRAVIWEVHVRDFSNTIQQSRYPGKYLAFTETGLTNAEGFPAGMDYLKDLGITHVHFQPLYDYATVDESSDAAQFNWGYDPKNYNVPEGSYATDPYHGEVRINELKQMVQALHKAGMGVVMDVVYNHTYSVDSNFNRIVPYYYYRFDSKGEPANGSGCGNETASERIMFRKYMVDSVTYWAEEYHLDGFRFDLMALHDVDTMQAAEAAIHTVNPHALIYGEGWTGGTTPLVAGNQASQANIKKITSTGAGIGSVAVFNDVIRDGLKGSVFDPADKGYINGAASMGNAAKVIFGLTGGVKNSAATWSVENDMVINYISCHDNHTLWDKLEKSNPDASQEERFLMNRLGISILMIGKGTPFFLAGEEMLRTKGGDHNSYASSDAVNNLDWDCLKEGSLPMRMYDFYKGLIDLRRVNSFFTQAEVTGEAKGDGVIHLTWTLNGKTVAAGLINPTDRPIEYMPPEAGDWQAILCGEEFPGIFSSGPFTVPGKGVLVLKK